MPLSHSTFVSFCTEWAPEGAEGKLFPFLALCVSAQIFTLLSACYATSQVADSVTIVAAAGRSLGASDRGFHARKAYTSCMCNLYAIFAIHCIGKSSPLHFES